MQSGGSPPRWRPGVPAPLNSLTVNPENSIIPRPHHSSHGSADIAVGAPTTGGSRNPQFSTSATSHRRIVPDILDDLDNFDDSPYVPPQVTQAELESYPALDPRLVNVHDPPNHDIQHQYPYEGGTSPADSHRSAESNWSTSSSSSASSRHYLEDPVTRYSQSPLQGRHTYPQHYPAYHGQHRLGLEHVRYGDLEHPSHAGGTYYRAPQSYSLDSLVFDNTGARATMPSQMHYPSLGDFSSSVIPATDQSSSISTFSVSPTSFTDGSRSRFPDAGPYLRQQLGISVHEPISLQSIPELPAGEKPSTPLPMLVKLAIYGSPNKQLTLQEIYAALENRFQWFRDHKHDKAWKARLLFLSCVLLSDCDIFLAHGQNSIRHNLSLNKVFKHVPRPVTEPGKGSYWQLDVSGGEGYKRLRKRRAKNKAMASEEEDEDGSEIDEDRPSSSDPTGLGRSSSTPVDDANIDPGLRNEGHVIGEGRTRSTTRRADGSPYPSQSPRYQQGSLPVVSGQDGSAPGQPSARFGQPSFGQTSFPTHPQTRPTQVATSSASFAALSSAPVALAPTASMITRPPLQHMASYDRTACIPHPQPPPRSGIEYVMEPGGLPAARRVRAHPEAQDETEADAVHSSPESSSGSSRTWNDGRSGSRTHGS